MDFLRFDWDRVAGFFSKFLSADYDELTELLGPFELTRQFRIAANKNKRTILAEYPEELACRMFDERRRLRPFAFTEDLYDALCEFMEQYTAGLLARLKKQGIRPFAPENAANRDLRRFLEMDLSGRTVIQVLNGDGRVRVEVDTPGGILALRFLGVSLFDYDGSLSFNEYGADELFRLPDCLEYNLGLIGGGLRVHFTDFALTKADGPAAAENSQSILITH